jgi:hypothetical protein
MGHWHTRPSVTGSICIRRAPAVVGVGWAVVGMGWAVVGVGVGGIVIVRILLWRHDVRMMMMVRKVRKVRMVRMVRMERMRHRLMKLQFPRVHLFSSAEGKHRQSQSG